MATKKRPCVIGGLFCCYTACDCNEITCLCHESGDCLCMRSSSCCATGVQHKGCGCTADKQKGECCMTSCFCCNCGLVTPKVICASYCRCCCLQCVRSFPSTEAYMNEDCACACSGLSCSPQFGCCSEAPECPAIEIAKTGTSVDPDAFLREPAMERY